MNTVFPLSQSSDKEGEGPTGKRTTTSPIRTLPFPSLVNELFVGTNTAITTATELSVNRSGAIRAPARRMTESETAS